MFIIHRILNLQMNRQVPCLLAVLHLGEAGVVHLLGLDVVLEEHLLQDGLVHLLDVVIEELLSLGGHDVVGHIPGELLLASKPRHPSSLSSWLADSWLADTWLADTWLSRSLWRNTSDPTGIVLADCPLSLMADQTLGERGRDEHYWSSCCFFWMSCGHPRSEFVTKVLAG